MWFNRRRVTLDALPWAGILLQPVGNGPHHDIAAQSWRVGPKESPPFQTQVCDAGAQPRPRGDSTPGSCCPARSPQPQLAPISGPFEPDVQIARIRLSDKTSRLRPRQSCRHGVVLVEAAGGGPSMRLGGRIDRPPRQALRARSHLDYARPRESRRRGRPRRGRFRHAPGGRRSRDGGGRSARSRGCGDHQWRRSALPT